MRIPQGPFDKGVVRSIGTKTAPKRSLRHSLGFFGAVAGSLGWIYQGQRVATFGTYTPLRWLQWGDKYVQQESRPTSEVYTDDGTTQTNLYTGKAQGAIYDDKFVAALDNGSADNARVYSDPSTLSQYCHLSNNMSEGWVAAISGSGPYTITFDNGGVTADTVYPANTSGEDPQYLLFIDDATKDATSAKLWAVSSPVWSGTDITSVQVANDPSGFVAVGDRVRLQHGATATDLFKPTEFFVYRDRLGAVYNDKLWFSGYPGRADVPITLAPVKPRDWTYWDALNFHNIGDSDKGAIKQVLPVGDQLLVFRENQTCLVYGYPPVDAYIDNQLQWRVISDDIGLSTYGGAVRVRNGSDVVFPGQGGWFIYSNGKIDPIDSAVRGHEFFNIDFDTAASAGDVVAFMDYHDHPERVPMENENGVAGIINQFPVMWLYYLPTGSWWPAVRATSNDSRHLVPFDNPEWSGSIGSVTHNGQIKLAVGTNDGIYTLNDPDVDNPTIENVHVQGFATHPIDESPEQKQFNNVSIHTDQPFDAELFVMAPVEGKNSGAAKDLPVKTGVAKTVGDMKIYAGYMRDAVLSPRISCGAGYIGEALLAGQDRWYNAYSSFTATSQAVTQKLYIDGRVDRIDVLASGVTTFDVVVYADDGTGLPDNSEEVRRFTVTVPHGGIKSTSDPYWYSVEFGKGGWTPTAGNYFIGLIGTATFRSFSAPDTLYNADQTVHSVSAALAVRAIQEVGAPFACKSIEAAYVEAEAAGDAIW